MNERIKECWIKAAREDAGETWDSQEQFIERFAELIVKECAELTLDHKSDDYYNGWLDYRDEIREHFGVEE
jgi:hypothetical protein